MAQPTVGWITCNECNASYNSERDLREHEKNAHRKFGSEPGSSELVGTQPNSFTIQLRVQKETPNREGGSGHSGSRQSTIHPLKTN